MQNPKKFHKSDAWVFPKALIPLEELRGRFNESLEIFVRALTEETFSYHGKYYDVNNVNVLQKPIQMSHQKIYTSRARTHNYEVAGQKK